LQGVLNATLGMNWLAMSAGDSVLPTILTLLLRLEHKNVFGAKASITWYKK